MDQEYYNKPCQFGKEYTNIELLHGKTNNSAKIIQESFVRGVQIWQRFLFDEGRENPNTTTSGPSSFKWRFAGGPMVAQHWMLAW